MSGYAHVPIGSKAALTAPKSNYRGRDASYLAPPAQIRASPIRAHGLYGAFFVKGGAHHFVAPLFVPFFCSTRAASILPPRPHICIAVARSGGQGRRFFSAAEGLSLTDASTAAGCRRSGGWPRDDPRGACHWPRAIAREPRLYSVEPCRVPTMKQSYASAGKAPRRRVHSPSGIAAIAVCGLPPPRIVIGYPAHQAQSGAEPCLSFPRYRVLLTPPAAARHRPAPRRS